MQTFTVTNDGTATLTLGTPDVAGGSRAAMAMMVAEEFGIARFAADWTEIIADESIDAVCIGTWPYMHAPLTIAALESGKHVLCEARMALNLREAREIGEQNEGFMKQVRVTVAGPPWTARRVRARRSRAARRVW